MTESDYKKIEKRIEEIEKRNIKVENDKEWETCILRKIIIIILTYIFVVIYLNIADNTNPFLGAIVPCAGFYISTQSIKIIKKIWLKRKENKNG